jgi:hypothetical protein
MSSKNRAKRRMDRVNIQEAIDANHPIVDELMRDRENRSAFLEDSLKNLMCEVEMVLDYVPDRYGDITEVRELCWKLTDLRNVYLKLLDSPKNVKVAALSLKQEIEIVLEKIWKLGYWYHREITTAS